MITSLIIVTVVVLAMAKPADAGGAQVTTGEFNTFAAGPGRGFDISGHVIMIRTASGKTIVNSHVTGLAPNTTYGSHVHNLPCGENNGGGHYQNVVGGDVDNVNEIWPGFTTNPDGVGNGKAKNDFIARPEAQSIVVHDVDGARIACADLS
jgi:Cu-Zn family superoxide dismutase